jgi:predicted GIY-YIG superfamily endonuclease
MAKIKEAIEDSRPTKLYRHYAADGTLLYVGISLCAVARLRQHKKKKAPWVDDIALILVEGHPSKRSALGAEASAIRKERPAHNFMHADRETERLMAKIFGEQQRASPVKLSAHLLKEAGINFDE